MPFRIRSPAQGTLQGRHHLVLFALRHLLESAVDGKVFEVVDKEIAEKTGIDRIYVLAEAAWRIQAALELEIEKQEAKQWFTTETQQRDDAASEFVEDAAVPPGGWRSAQRAQSALPWAPSEGPKRPVPHGITFGQWEKPSGPFALDNSSRCACGRYGVYKDNGWFSANDGSLHHVNGCPP